MLELSLDGVFVPAAVVWAGVAFFLSCLVERLLGRTALYGWVWHPGLFDVALFVILWGAICAVCYQLAFSAQ